MTNLLYWAPAGTAACLILIGLWGILTRRNLLRLALAFTIADTGINLMLVWIGYIPGRTAPVLDSSVDAGSFAALVVDPLPQALVLTSIVIGVAVSALFVTVAVLVHSRTGSSDVSRLKELRW